LELHFNVSSVYSKFKEVVVAPARSAIAERAMPQSAIADYAKDIPLPAAKRPAGRTPRVRAPGKAPSPKRTDALDTAVAANIRIRRLQAGLSQAALAAALGVSFQQVQKYEKGVNRVGGGRLVVIARVLGCPVAALYEGVSERAAPGRPSALALLADPLALRLAAAFVKLRDRAVRRAVVALVQGVAAAGL
jgi:transcriptional regulator with XRE-family HTH domain